MRKSGNMPRMKKITLFTAAAVCAICLIVTSCDSEHSSNARTDDQKGREQTNASQKQIGSSDSLNRDFAHASLTPENIQKLPHDKIESALPYASPENYYFYAARLFSEGKKDDAVFWFYVGQLRYRFFLKTNPNLDPSGAPALFSALSATVGQTINEYAGGDIDKLVYAIDKALKWDDDTMNGFTSKEKFATIYEQNRAGLKNLRSLAASDAEKIRERRKQNGLENRD